MSTKILIEAININKSFQKVDKQPLNVLENIDFQFKEKEIVSILGKSGSGKSTFLRILAGLIPPSTGEIKYRGNLVNKPVPDIAMVFQSFALMPWLTVLQNVELGLEARGISAKERRERAIKAIDVIGLDGFENAYPRELSGGMKQRVGFARALVIEPDLLLMDEPFSALDVLTAENLRNDLLELWHTEQQTKGILFVTHNIEEAVLLSDRVLIFGNNPGCIRYELKIDLPYPRNSQDSEVQRLIDKIYILMTRAQEQEELRLHKEQQEIQGEGALLNYRVPQATVSELIGLLEQINDLKNKKSSVDLPELADEVRLDIDDLFPSLEALSKLQLATLSEGDVTITKPGVALIFADITDRKILFKKHLTNHIPLVQFICDTIKDKPSGKIDEDDILEPLQEYFTKQEAERILHTIIGWGRYAEVFNYDSLSEKLTLEDIN
jgi:NitT/TauT family transport system ATP-binding protein